MKFSSFLFLFIFLSALPLASAETYRQFENINFIEVVTLEGFPSDSIDVNLTITDPKNIILVYYSPMTYNSVAKTFNYTLTNTSETGVYTRCVYASGNGINETACRDFFVTPSGKEQTSFLDNPMLLLLGLLGFLFLALGVYQGNYFFGFISSIMFLLGGVYTMIYGFNNEQTLYTQGVAITILGLSFILMIISSYEVWGGWGGGDDKDD